MSPCLRLEFDRCPSALRYMARAFCARRRMTGRAEAPEIEAIWRGYRPDVDDVRDFRLLVAMPAGDSAPVLLIHTTLFRLQLALLTHPVFPLPIWRILQVRNRLLWRRTPTPGARLELRSVVAGWRFLERGIEVELVNSAAEQDDIFFESQVTFYVRGRFGAPISPSPWTVAPAVEGDPYAHWRVPRAGALRFGELTGDYNGIHLWSPYARLFGFKRAFSHPQRVLAQCLERIAGPISARPARLDVWLKGPVYYDADLTLRRQEGGDGTRFALWTDEDQRPAIIGRLRELAPGERLAGDRAD